MASIVISASRAEFKLWHFKDSQFLPVFQETIEENRCSIHCTYNWSNSSRHLFVETCGSLWRYDLCVNETVRKTHIPIGGGSAFQRVEPIKHSLMKIYLRIYDLERGKKLWPWYEALDPFDNTNVLPLYDEKPATTVMRDYWK